ISADHIATLTSQQVYDAVRTWATQHDPDLATVLDAEPALALRALAVEREGVDNPRKDLRKWSDFRPAYGFFFPQLLTPLSGPADERLALLGVDSGVAATFARDFVDGYQHLGDPQEWFSQIRELAAKHGFAPNAKEYKKNPDAYPGSIREASQLVRVVLTGSTRSPDLHAITQAIGADEVLRRLRALAD
ncbi:MAG: glutamate--tRNA ligase, partial [Pseudonocardiaceae bacterium]